MDGGGANAFISPPLQGRGRGWGLSANAALVDRPHPGPPLKGRE